MSAGEDTHFMSPQRATWLIAGLCTCLLAGLASASPPPRLPWSQATIRVHPSARVGPVQIEMECPGGELRLLSVSARDFKGAVRMKKLKKLNLANSCSGAGTHLLMESETSTEPLGLVLTVFMSSEYVRRDLEFVVLFKARKFTSATYMVTYGGTEPTQIDTVEL